MEAWGKWFAEVADRTVQNGGLRDRREISKVGTKELPGHSDDSLCFYHRESETLLSGDAVVTLDGRAWFNPECVDAAASNVVHDPTARPGRAGSMRARGRAMVDLLSGSADQIFSAALKWADVLRAGPLGTLALVE